MGRPEIRQWILSLHTITRSFRNSKPGSVLILFFGKSGGQDRIRTCEGDASRFTVCPVWPLRNLPFFLAPALVKSYCLAGSAKRGCMVIDLITIFANGKSLLSVG